MTYTTLLFEESPYIATFLLSAIGVATYLKKTLAIIILIIITLCMMLFYRHNDINYECGPNDIICPADGIITDIIDLNTHCCISIYLDVFNQHTQIYPCNGVVVNRICDCTGQFELVINREKSRFNEKLMHIIAMDNGAGLMQVTQIAGFLPRRISASKQVPEKVQGGQYLGIIKFGSRVEVLIPKTGLTLNAAVNSRVRPGDLLGKYVN